MQDTILTQLQLIVNEDPCAEYVRIDLANADYYRREADRYRDLAHQDPRQRELWLYAAAQSDESARFHQGRASRRDYALPATNW